VKEATIISPQNQPVITMGCKEEATIISPQNQPVTMSVVEGVKNPRPRKIEKINNCAAFVRLVT